MSITTEVREVDYHWKDGGEEWSAPWGGSAAQWFGSIYPRVRGFLPTATILEIGPGFGRWTHYLKEHCETLHLVDPAENCIAACRRRFSAETQLIYHVNDGRSLAMIPDRSIDFVFSFDSLVHVPRELVQSYLRQLADKLKPDGAGFLHHSNLGQYGPPLAGQLPGRARKLLTKAKILESNHQRAPDMTAELFRSDCAEAGLRCICQEVVNWRGRRLIDCFTAFAREGSSWRGSGKVLRNPNFMREAQLIRRWSQLYPSKPAN